MVIVIVIVIIYNNNLNLNLNFFIIDLGHIFFLFLFSFFLEARSKNGNQATSIPWDALKIRVIGVQYYVNIFFSDIDVPRIFVFSNVGDSRRVH